MTEQELREVFEAHGQVEEVHMVCDRDTGRPKGFAFIEMPLSIQAKAAIKALNGHIFHQPTRTLTVNEARPRQERSSGGGGTGGYGTRGGSGGGFVSRYSPWSGSRSGAGVSKMHLVGCIRSSVVNKWVLYANPFLRFEQESGFLSFRKPSNIVVNYGYRTLDFIINYDIKYRMGREG